MKYYIRYAKPQDAKVLGYIHSESWKIAYKNIVPDSVLDNINAEKREKFFHKALTEKWEEDAIIFVDDEPVGLVCLGKCRDEDCDNDCGEIWGIYLLPQHWNKGIGKMLIQWGIEELKKRDYKRVALWVLEDNINARKFYEKMGFHYDGTIKQINIGKELNEIRYIKNCSLSLYSLSIDLKEKILKKAEAVEKEFNGLIKYEEYIVLPDYGEKIIIRFYLTEDKIECLEELNEIETKIRSILGKDYWGILLEKTFERFGFNGQNMRENLLNANVKISDDILKYNQTLNSEYIKKDNEILRKLLKLNKEHKIWEIQPVNEEVDALILIAFDSKEEEIIEFEGKKLKILYFNDYKIFKGMNKVYFKADINKTSVASEIIAMKILD